MKIDWKNLLITVGTIIGVAYAGKFLKDRFPGALGWLPF
jgi:hypothetical protein